MADLEARIYDYLMEENRPVLCSEICNKKQFADIEKSEVISELDQMAKKELIYKTTNNGEIYYSVEKPDSVDYDTIGNIASLFKSLSDLLGDEDQDSTLFVDISDIELTYSKNLIVEGDAYTIKIPDSFNIISEEGRDFVAYLDNPKAQQLTYESDGALIQILPASFTPTELDMQFRLQQTYGEVYGLIFWTNQKIKTFFSMANSVVDYFSTPVGGCIHTKAKEGNWYHHHFYFMVWCNNGYKQIHFQVDNIKGSDEEVKKLIIQIMRGFKLKKPLPPIKPLNDSSYKNIKLTKQNTEAWIENFKLNEDDYGNLYLTQIKVEKARIADEQRSGTLSEFKVKQRLRKCLKEYAAGIDVVISQVIDFVEALDKEGQDEQLLAQIYAAIKEYLDIKSELVINLGDETIKEIPSRIEEAKKIIF